MIDISGVLNTKCSQVPMERLELFAEATYLTTLMSEDAVDKKLGGSELE